jgi:hypothetical protein
MFQVQVVEQDAIHGDEDGQKVMIKCSNLEKRKRKTKPYADQGKGINRDFILPIKTQ